jgi:hypothetical protein
MSINEHRTQNLSFSWTAQQKREAEAVCYGLRTEDMNMPNQKFTPEEIQHMRTIIAQEDKKGIREFDLNNPPKMPYKHQEYPKIIYHHNDKVHKIVHSPAEEEVAIDEGWNLLPPVFETAKEITELAGHEEGNPEKAEKNTPAKKGRK